MNLAHISTGDILRAEMKAGSELGKLAKSYIDKGALVPDQVIIDMMGERMKADDAKGGVLLDGFPRTVAQAEALDAIAAIDAVVNLEVDVQVIVDRVLARRVCETAAKCTAQRPIAVINAANAAETLSPARMITNRRCANASVFTKTKRLR